MGKLGFAFVGLGMLTLMNLRGVKESVTAIAPIFGVFVVTHAIVLLVTIGGHAAELGAVMFGEAADIDLEGFFQGIGFVEPRDEHFGLFAAKAGHVGVHVGADAAVFAPEDFFKPSACEFAPGFVEIGREIAELAE